MPARSLLIKSSINLMKADLFTYQTVWAGTIKNQKPTPDVLTNHQRSNDFNSVTRVTQLVGFFA